MVATGRVNVKPMITHHFKMEDTLKAFETAKTGAGNAIKVLIHVNPAWKNKDGTQQKMDSPQGNNCAVVPSMYNYCAYCTALYQYYMALMCN